MGATGHPEKDRFLAAFELNGIVSYACKAAGVPRSTVYLWREQDPEFARAMEEAKEVAIESLEAEAIRRATNADDASDLLLMFMLKAARPEKYRENQRVEHVGPGGGAVQIEARAVDQRFMLSPEAMRAMEAAERAMLKAPPQENPGVSNGD